MMKGPELRQTGNGRAQRKQGHVQEESTEYGGTRCRQPRAKP